MSDKAGRTRDSQADILFGATTVSDPPTVAELDALTKIDGAIVDDGELSTERTGTAISISGLSDTEGASIAGRIENSPITSTLWRHFDGTDAEWALFDDSNNATQALVVCRAGFTGGTPTAADIVDVYRVQVGARSTANLTGGGDQAQRFDVELYVADDVEFDRVVAA